MGLRTWSFLVYKSATINQEPPMMNLQFFTFLNLLTEIIENRKHHLLKINRSYGAKYSRMSQVKFVEASL